MEISSHELLKIWLANIENEQKLQGIPPAKTAMPEDPRKSWSKASTTKASSSKDSVTKTGRSIRNDGAGEILLPSGRARGDSSANTNQRDKEQHKRKQLWEVPYQKLKLPVRPTAYWVLSRDVQYQLNKYFREENQHPNKAQRELLLRQLESIHPGIPMEKLTRWFQNRRAYVRRLGL